MLQGWFSKLSTRFHAPLTRTNPCEAFAFWRRISGHTCMQVFPLPEQICSLAYHTHAWLTHAFINLGHNDHFQQTKATAVLSLPLLFLFFNNICSLKAASACRVNSGTMQWHRVQGWSTLIRIKPIPFLINLQIQHLKLKCQWLQKNDLLVSGSRCVLQKHSGS